MPYQLRVERRAFKQLEKLPQAARARVAEAILALEQDPFPPGKKWKRLGGTGGLLRLRVGDYRILYEFADEEVHVLAVIKRSELERWLRRL